MTSTTSLDAKYEKFARAMFLEDLPVNFKPFENALDGYVSEGGDPTSDTAKAICWMKLSALNNTSSATLPLSGRHICWPGQHELDMFSEWCRLDEVFNPEP